MAGGRSGPVGVKLLSTVAIARSPLTTTASTVRSPVASDGPSTPAALMPADRPFRASINRASISASDVGDFVYCARAFGLRRVVATADDPATAALQAQGLSESDSPLAANWLAEGENRRATDLLRGARRHQDANRAVCVAGGLALVGVGLLGAGGLLVLVELVGQLR